MKLIVGFDGSSASKEALALGSSLVDATGGELVVTAVFHQDLTDGEGFKSSSAEYFGKAFATAGMELGHAGFVRSEVFDTPARGLRRVAELESAAAVVIGPTHRGKLGHVLPGSTAEQLLHHAPCPIAVAGRGFRSHRSLERIGVAYDGSPASDEGLKTAFALARLLSAEVHVITVGVELGPYGSFADDVRESRRRTEARQQRALEQVPEDVAAKGIIREGRPGSELARASSDLDLMVIGSRGHGSVIGALLGNVAAELTWRADCSVLVVPSRAGAERLREAAGESERQGVKA